MGATLALLICSVGVAGLFYLDRDKSARTSKALWLPVIWLWIAGSRPVSLWLGIGGGSGGSLSSSVEGSPLDAAVFEVLILAGLVVLFRRGNKPTRFLTSIGPL